MAKTLEGSCLCGSVVFKVKDEFSQFHLCHCNQCQKITGSAYAANLFTRPDNIEWLRGADLTVRFEHPERNFTKVFCSVCGSGLPHLSKSGRHLVVPAGSLSEQPSIRPQDNIFWSEHMPWLDAAVRAKKYDHFPE